MKKIPSKNCLTVHIRTLGEDDQEKVGQTVYADFDNKIEADLYVEIHGKERNQRLVHAVGRKTGGHRYSPAADQVGGSHGHHLAAQGLSGVEQKRCNKHPEDQHDAAAQENSAFR